MALARRRRCRSNRKLVFEPLDHRRMLAGNIFHYAADPVDVNMDGHRNTADLRAVMSDLMEHGARELEGPIAHYMVDVSGDGVLNTQDVRQVFAMLTAEQQGQQYTDVVADEPLVTREYDIAEGGGGGMSEGGGDVADFDALINLIRNTVAPDSWAEISAEIEITNLNDSISLVVTQTEEVQQQIAGLLDQLRQLQDLQITIETRFITLSDNFFEEIGVDFDFHFDDIIQPGQGQTPIVNGPGVSIGVDADGNQTVDLDLPFAQGSFTIGVPDFGGFDPQAGANVGFAILSDIEAFFFLQAAQADIRENILQAPRVTLFNGQVATIIENVVDRVNANDIRENILQAPRVTLFNGQVATIIDNVVDRVNANASVGFQPVINTLPNDTILNVQPVITADRRYVQIVAEPIFTFIGDVENFTFEASTDIQLPNFDLTVFTTVSVPDGGTVLLGGLRTQTDIHAEIGVPVLSNLPYINRLFRNVAVSTDTTSLMLMVTPRIIIQEEQE